MTCGFSIMPMAREGDHPLGVRIIPAGTPPAPRVVFYHCQLYDPASNRMLVFGGDVTAFSGGVSTDSWVLTGANVGAGCQVSTTPFYQCNTTWAANPYNFTGATICDVGCTLSSLAMALDAAGVLLIPNSSQGLVPTDPGSLNEFMTERGPNVDYVDDGTQATGNVRIETTTRDV